VAESIAGARFLQIDGHRVAGGAIVLAGLLQNREHRAGSTDPDALAWCTRRLPLGTRLGNGGAEGGGDQDGEAAARGEPGKRSLKLALDSGAIGTDGITNSGEINGRTLSAILVDQLLTFDGGIHNEDGGLITGLTGGVNITSDTTTFNGGLTNVGDDNIPAPLPPAGAPAPRRARARQAYPGHHGLP
jgi:hypothetical protein